MLFQAVAFAAVRGVSESLRVSTKADIEALRVSSKADIESLRISRDAKIETTAERTKAKILKWVFGTVATQTVVLLAAMIGILHGVMH